MLRGLLAMVNSLHMELEQLDVKLHSIMEIQKRRFIFLNQKGSLILKFVEKSIYGCKQSPRKYYKSLIHFLYYMVTFSTSLTIVFSQSNCHLVPTYICCYMLMTCSFSAKNEINHMKALLKNEFHMKDFGATKKIIGMEIQRDRRIGRLSILNRSTLRKSCSHSTLICRNQLELLWHHTLNLIKVLYP